MISLMPMVRVESVMMPISRVTEISGYLTWDRFSGDFAGLEVLEAE